jgi:hypothetical protein
VKPMGIALIPSTVRLCGQLQSCPGRSESA